VVADEVRKLAERTTAATGEISRVIQAIQEETRSAITTIRAGSEQASSGAGLARQAADALERINLGARQTLDMASEIAGTMAEQSAKSGRIAEMVTDIMGLADRNASLSKDTLAEAGQLAYLATNLEEVGTVFKLGKAGEDARRIHERMPGIVQDAARKVGRVLEEAVDRGQLRLEDLFDQDYKPIANTKPQKFRTRFDEICDRILPSVQEPYLNGNNELTYAIACDLRGYVPTHNNRFCQPLTGDEKKDFVGNRTKRIFSDPVGKRCGDHELPFLLQTYRRDTGEIMHDISAPVYVKGRHWGGVRIGYRTE
jgi:methyl-accepting chemotaxis protein